MAADSLISIIVPCFNEEAVIAQTVVRLKETLEQLGMGYEIILINDGSADSTLHQIEKICKDDLHVKAISFSRNFGHQAAVSAGIKYATGNIAVIIDADLQDPPELIPEMVKKWKEENCNVVYAVRERRAGETFFKKASAKLYYRVISYLSDVSIPIDTGDFRLIDRKVMDAFNGLGEKHKYVRGLISWIGFKQVPVYYQRDSRFAGETKYSFFKMLKFARTGLVYFTKRPLRLAWQLGLFSFFVGIALIVYVIISKFWFPQTTMKGWASLLIALVFFGGIQLITIGLLGEYIASIFDEVKGRPEYISERTINFK